MSEEKPVKKEYQIPVERTVFIIILLIGVAMMALGKGGGGFWTTIIGIAGWLITKYFDEERR